MLISEKTTGSIEQKIVSKEAYSIVTQLEKKQTVKKAQAKVENARKKNLGSLGTPPPTLVT